MATPTKTLSELADHVQGKVIGDGGIVIRRFAAIDEAGPGEITFVANPRYQRYLDRCAASAVIVGPGIVKEAPSVAGKAYLETPNPYLAFAKILQIFHPPATGDQQISPLASIADSAHLGEKVTLYPNVFVCADARVGSGSVLYPGVFVGEGAHVGKDCVLYPQAVIRERCRLGDRVILHPGVVIGSDGFGYARDGDARIKIPQIGTVEIEDDVEIGANTTVDRGTLGRTVIGRGTKIDNLVQIAHNVSIGEHCVIAAQAGIAGSTRIGRAVTLAGQVGVVNHVTIGDGATIGPQSGVAQSVPAGAVLSSGLPAAPHHEWLKVMALLPHLPKLWRLVRGLEKQVANFAKGGDGGRPNHA